MSFADQSLLPDRAFGIFCSLAIHVALGLLLIWPFAGPTSDRRTVARDQGVLVVELIPLASGDASSHAARLKSAPPADQTLGATRASAGMDGGETRSPIVGGGTRDSGKALDQGGAPDTVAVAEAGGQPALAGAASQAFRAQLLRHIERFRRYPQQAQAAGTEGVVQVHFVMNRKGEVLDAWIEMSSGSKLLDDEAIAAILRARPLPPPPASWPDSFGVTLPIGFSLL